MPSSPPTILTAVGGCSVSSCETASEARPLAELSRYLPSSMNVMSIALVSKHALLRPTWPRVRIERSVKKTEYAYATVVPSTTSTSMFAEPCEQAAYARR